MGSQAYTVLHRKRGYKSLLKAWFSVVFELSETVRGSGKFGRIKLT
jgi:hypothetical protein